MKPFRPVLLCTLTLAATSMPAVAGAMPVRDGPPRQPPAPSAAGGLDARGGTTALGGPGSVAIVVAVLLGMLATGVVLRLRPAPRPRRRADSVTAGEPAAAVAPSPEPTSTPSTEPAESIRAGAPAERSSRRAPPVHTPEPLKLVPCPPEHADGKPARERHVALYNAEYTQQAIRIRRLRETVSVRVALGETSLRGEP